MFKRDVRKQILYVLVPLVALLIGLALVIFVFTDFYGRTPTIIAILLAFAIFLLSFSDLAISKPIVDRNTDASVNGIIEDTLQRLSDNVLRRFEKGNAGTDQQIMLLQYCVVLLAHDARDIDQLEEVLSRMFHVSVQLEYETKYSYIPSIDTHDKRSGKLKIQVKGHSPVEIKVW